METLETIRNRTSLKTHLSPRTVEPEKITQILDAARHAPSGRNTQPWCFIVVQGKANVEPLVTKTFSEANQVAKDAPVLIIACAHPLEAIRGGRDNALFDVGLAVENLLLAATALGLVTHPMRGVNEDALKKLLHIPDDVRFVVATPLAYPLEGSYADAARERLRQRTRKSLTEITYSNVWGTPL
jgi:nitroreductase